MADPEPPFLSKDHERMGHSKETFIEVAIRVRLILRGAGEGTVDLTKQPLMPQEESGLKHLYVNGYLRAAMFRSPPPLA
jgi:hypothetical protein